MAISSAREVNGGSERMMNQFSEVKNSVKPTGHFLNRMLFILCFVMIVALVSGIGTPALATVPVVSDVSPNQGMCGYQDVGISGSGFTGATEVNFGSVEAAYYAVLSDSYINAKPPCEPEGTVDVTVTTPGGTSATSSADQFLFYPPWQVQMSSDKSVYHVGDTIIYTITGFGYSVDHIDWGTVLLDPNIKNITGIGSSAMDVYCHVSGNSVSCFTQDGGPEWGSGDPGLTISGTVTGGTKLVSNCSFSGFDDNGNELDASASNTAKVVYEPPAPEFPSPLLPASMVIGFLGAVFYIKRTREK